MGASNTGPLTSHLAKYNVKMIIAILHFIKGMFSPKKESKTHYLRIKETS